MNRYNFNNLKNLIPVNSMAVVISILALFVAVSSGNTPCLSADSVCSSGVDPEYTNNLSVKAGTTNKATITHNNLNGDNQYFFPESNYARTSSVAVLKKGSDQLNILDLQNGSIIVGQSQTTTVGALRVQTSTNPVLQLYGSAGWQDVNQASPDQNVFTTISGNSGSLTASTTTTSIKLEASADSGLTVVASGDKLEIQSSGGGGGFSPAMASYNLDSSLGYASNPNNFPPNSSTIFFGYNGTSDVTTEMYDIGNCWSTSIANIPSDNVNGLLFVYDTNCGSHPYKISYKIQMYDATQGQSSQQISRVSTQLYYLENSTTRHSMKYGDNTINGYDQYSQSYVSDFNNTIYDEAIICLGYDTSESNSIFLRVRGKSRSHIKGDTANYKFSTISMERLNLGTLTTCDNTVTPYPSMN